MSDSQNRLHLALGFVVLQGVLSVPPVGVTSGREGSSDIQAHPAVSMIAETDARERFLIEPGLRVGPLKLGDTQERALELYPRKPDIDQETLLPNCGIEYVWADIDSTSPGTLIIRFKEGRVFQIESNTVKYQTRDRIKSGDTPEQVHRHYRELQAYAYLGATSEAEANRHLIFWTDQEKGIAFAFAYSAVRQQRYLHKIIIYKPKSQFCPEGDMPDSRNWRRLAPYSLELPNAMASQTSSPTRPTPTTPAAP